MRQMPIQKGGTSKIKISSKGPIAADRKENQRSRKIIYHTEGEPMKTTGGDLSPGGRTKKKPNIKRIIDSRSDYQM